MTYHQQALSKKSRRTEGRCYPSVFLLLLIALLPSSVILNSCTPSDSAKTTPAASKAPQNAFLAIVEAEINANDLSDAAKADVIKSLSETETDNIPAIVKTLIASLKASGVKSDSAAKLVLKIARRLGDSRVPMCACHS